MNSITQVLVLSLLVAITYGQVYNEGLTANCAEPAGKPDQFQLGMCNCYSGYAPSSPLGTDCSSHARCAQLSTDSDAATAGNQPGRPTTTFTNDQLTIIQKVPIVSNRRSSRIKFVQPLINGMPGNTPGVAGAETCNYPGQLWSKTLNTLDCQDVFTAVIPWTQSGFCGFVKDTNSSTPQKNVLKTTVVHTYEEAHNNGKGKVTIRTLSTSYLISVSFAIQKTVTSDTFAVTIADPTATGFIRVVALGDAIYDVTSGNTIIQFRTTAAWPYQLDSNNPVFNGVVPAITGIDATSVTITEDSDIFAECDGKQDTDCTQRWTVTIVVPPALCNIQGVYTFQDTLICRDNATASPCPKNPPPVQFSLSIRQTDLCAADAIDTSAENKYTLTPFFGPSDSSPTFSYQTGDMIYWQVTVVDPLATLDRVTFANIMIYVTSGDGTLQTDVLFDNEALTSTGTSALLTIKESLTPVAPGQAAALTFQYKLLRSVLEQTVAQLTSDNNVVEVTTSVTVNLLYHGNQKRTFTEKSTTATQARTVQLMISPDVKDAPAAAAAPSKQQGDSIFDEFFGSATTLTTTTTLIGSLFVVIFAVLLF
jgi:hypothetical protein